MIRKITGFALAAASLAFAPHSAGAQEAEYRPVEEKHLASGTRSIESDKSYIFVNSEFRTNGIFIKTPSTEEIAEYEAEWEEEFEKAKKRYPGRVRRYEEDVKIWNRRRRGNKPEPPVEPTEENFSIGDLERRMLVPFGPQFVFNKSKEEDGTRAFTYLQEVEPGEYTYYGPLFYAPNGAVAGTCLCMGTVKFEARAGEIVNLGNFLQMKWVSDEAANATSIHADQFAGRVPEPVDYTLPASLADYPHAPAELRAAGKLNNYFGIMIGRMAPIDGVLGYDRDTVIDLREQAMMEAAEEAADAMAEAMDEEVAADDEPVEAMEDAAEAVEMAEEAV